MRSHLPKTLLAAGAAVATLLLTSPALAGVFDPVIPDQPEADDFPVFGDLGEVGDSPDLTYACLDPVLGIEGVCQGGEDDGDNCFEDDNCGTTTDEGDCVFPPPNGYCVSTIGEPMALIPCRLDGDCGLDGTCQPGGACGDEDRSACTEVSEEADCGDFGPCIVPAGLGVCVGGSDDGEVCDLELDCGDAEIQGVCAIEGDEVDDADAALFVDDYRDADETAAHAAERAWIECVGFSSSDPSDADAFSFEDEVVLFGALNAGTASKTLKKCTSACEDAYDVTATCIKDTGNEISSAVQRACEGHGDKGLQKICKDNAKRFVQNHTKDIAKALNKTAKTFCRTCTIEPTRCGVEF